MCPVFDIRYDTTPQNPFGKPRGAKITDLKAALTAFNSTSYSADRLNQMSKGDLIYACQIHGLTVAGL